jgi:HlyD family secretion protein
VDVSAQVSGPIIMLGPDPRGRTDPQFKGKSIDFGSPVSKGDVLALVDPRLYQFSVAREQAGVARAAAKLQLAKLEEVAARAGLARAEDLAKNKSISSSDLAMAKLKVEAARASVAAAEASLQESKTELGRAQFNRDQTRISSPVDGIVLDVRVIIGKDPRKMQIWASVNEADIARIHVGMPADFTVGAFSKEVFHGKVEQIRLNAQTINQVVLYRVIVGFDNPDLKLLPYMTACVQFQTGDR